MRPARLPSLAVCLGLALLPGGPAFAACSFSASSGWASGAGGTGDLRAAPGDSCAVAIHSDPANRILASALAVEEAPRHGTLTLEGGSFRYRADAAYVGADRFVLSGQGRVNSGAVVRLKGTVTVTIGR